MPYAHLHTMEITIEIWQLPTEYLNYFICKYISDGLTLAPHVDVQNHQQITRCSTTLCSYLHSRPVFYVTKLLTFNLCSTLALYASSSKNDCGSYRIIGEDGDLWWGSARRQSEDVPPLKRVNKWALFSQIEQTGGANYSRAVFTQNSRHDRKCSCMR